VYEVRQLGAKAASPAAIFGLAAPRQSLGPQTQSVGISTASSLSAGSRALLETTNRPRFFSSRPDLPGGTEWNGKCIPDWVVRKDVGIERLI
jgi:hypothetical protein